MQQARRLRTKAVDEKPVAKSSIANGERIHAQLIQDGQDDARPSEDDVSPLGLQSNDLAPHLNGLRPVQLDLALDLRAVQGGPLDDIRIVLRHLVADCGEIGDRTTHPGERVRLRAPADSGEILGNGSQRLGENFG